MKKKVCALCGCIIGLALAFFPIPGLQMTARAGLGILCWAIIWWIAKVLPDFITASIMAVFYIVGCGIPMNIMFSAFSESTIWLLFASFTLSIGLNRCGLMQRISLYIIKLFPCTFAGQILGLITAGTVVGPFIPNMSAKSAILAPLSLGICDSMGYEHKGKQANGLFLAMLSGVRNPGPLFISASVLGYAFLGLYPQEIAEKYTMGRWFLAALPWFVVVSVLNYWAIILLFSPKGNEEKSKEDINQKIHQLGPMTKNEKRMMIIVLATIFMWVTEGIHKIPAGIVAIIAMSLTLALEILSVKEFKSNMAWESLIFIGITLGIAPTFAALGINDWIVDICRPIFSEISSVPWALVLSIGIFTILLRFFIAAEVATVNVIMVFLIPLAMGFGINPWILGFSVYVVICPWFFMYQNPVYMAAWFSVNGEMAEHLPVSLYCILYLLICLIGLVLTVPLWIATGIFYL